MSAERTVVLWCPDWPVRAAVHEQGLDADAPVAIIEHGTVFAGSAAARRAGVVRGLKLREAQYRCPELIVLGRDADQEARAFEPVVRAVESVVPGVEVRRPGLLAMRARGPVRYYGGEPAAAAALLATAAGAGVDDARVGIADGPFAAEQAARAAHPHRRPTGEDATPAPGGASDGTPDGTPGDADASGAASGETGGTDAPDAGGASSVFAVPPGGSAAFLAPLPVSLVVDERTATLLTRLGVRRLGEFAALPADDVLRRFGPVGAIAHERAAGRDGSRVAARTPPPDFDVEVVFEPPLDRVDQLAFAMRARADEFADRLRARRLVATAIRVELDDERGRRSSRLWSHPRWFTSADVVDRVRWQLQGDGSADRSLAAPVVRVHVLPERVESTGAHEAGLWGGGPDERVHHGLTRVQSMLGHDAVVTPVLGGGRTLAERAVLVPWGDQAPASTADRPWPGRLPGLAPASVFRERVAVRLADADGQSVAVDERGGLSAPPARFAPDGTGGGGPAGGRAVRAWAGPWPLVERWWDAERARRLHRLQLVDETGEAWLLLRDESGWWLEAAYD